MPITSSTVITTAGSVSRLTTVLGTAPASSTETITIPDGALLLEDTITWLLFDSGDYLQAEAA